MGTVHDVPAEGLDGEVSQCSKDPGLHGDKGAAVLQVLPVGGDLSKLCISQPRRAPKAQDESGEVADVDALKCVDFGHKVAVADRQVGSERHVGNSVPHRRAHPSQSYPCVYLRSILENLVRDELQCLKR